MEDYLDGSQPKWKPYRKQMTLACLASQFCTELGPAQPQLVSFFLGKQFLLLECDWQFALRTKSGEYVSYGSIWVQADGKSYLGTGVVINKAPKQLEAVYLINTLINKYRQEFQELFLMCDRMLSPLTGNSFI